MMEAEVDKLEPTIVLEDLGLNTIETITTTDTEKNSMLFCENQNNSETLEKLRAQRNLNKGTDISLSVGGVIFKAHRSILSASSPFFESVLKSAKIKEEIGIPVQVDADTFEVLLSYMYSGTISINGANVDNLLQLATHLSIFKLICYCEEYLEKFMAVENCLQIKELCEIYGLTRLNEPCMNFLHDNLQLILQQPGFLSLTFKKLENFLTDPEIGCDNIPLDALLNALTAWVNEDLAGRTIDFQKLLMIINWTDYDQSEILTYIRNQSLFQDNQLCLFFILNTLEINNILFEEYANKYEQLKKLYEVEEQKDEGNEIFESKEASQNLATNEMIEISKSPEKNKKRGSRNCSLSTTSVETLGEEPERRSARRQTKKKSVTHDLTLEEGKSKRKRILFEATGESNEQSDQPVFDSLKESSANPTNSFITKNKLHDGQIDNAEDLCEERDAAELYDDVDYTGAEGETSKDMLDMKTEYCVRGKRHSATLAQWREGVKCPHCCYIGHSASRLEHHLVKVHQEDTTYKCKMCEFTCKWNREYYKHMKQHFEGPPYKCENCDYTCDRIQFILSHLMRHTDEKPFICDKCPFRSRTRGNLVVHLRVHTGEKPYKCQFCDRKFAMKNTLDQHMATHRDDRPFLCDACGFTTKYQSHLLSHKRIHTGNVFHCEQEGCTYFTPRRSQLAAHMRSHLSIRTHICATCGRAFIERSHLIRHERIHLDEKPFNCDQCDYRSTRRDKLKDHILKHHGENAIEKVQRPKKRKFDSKMVALNSATAQIVMSSASTSNGASSDGPLMGKAELIQFQGQGVPQNVSIAIGDEVYESQIMVTPVSTPTKTATIQAANGQEIQIANVSEQDLATANLIYEYANGELTIANARLMLQPGVEYVDGQETVIIEQKDLAETLVEPDQIQHVEQVELN